MPTLNFKQVLPLVLLFLSACAPTAQQNRIPQSSEANTAPQIPATSEELLQQARTTTGTEANQLYLQAATLQATKGELDGALSALDLMSVSGMSPQQRAQMLVLRADISLQRDQPQQALGLLETSLLPSLSILDSDLQQQIKKLRSAAYAKTGATLNSILELISLDMLLQANERRSNHGQIWQKVVSLPSSQLQALATETEDDIAKGWFELGHLARPGEGDLELQFKQLQEWRSSTPAHPAALVLPPQLEMLETLAKERPQQIALLLPMDTAAGTVIRDAFMSAYFLLQENGGKVPKIRIYDTSTTSDIKDLHRQARADGAQLVIGPLLKQQVSQLQSESDLGVTTLALNTIDAPIASAHLFQFSLSPEDEARQLAEKVWQDGHRRLAILSPVDDNISEVAIRKRESFRAAWEKLGGTIVASDHYREDYTDSISRMMLLQESTDRSKVLGQLLGRSVVSQARRRQDVDSIFLVAQPAAARQIIPSLSYLYSGDIPVYANQDVYSGTSRQADDRDLNGVIFGESPWVLGLVGDHKRLKQTFPVNSAQNLRLQAFAIDAFTLYPRLRLLQADPGITITGSSGMLKLGPNHTIVRELSWATIADGLVTPR